MVFGIEVEKRRVVLPQFIQIEINFIYLISFECGVDVDRIVWHHWNLTKFNMYGLWASTVNLAAVMDIKMSELCADINFTINLRHRVNLFTFTYLRIYLWAAISPMNRWIVFQRNRERVNRVWSRKLLPEIYQYSHIARVAATSWVSCGASERIYKAPADGMKICFFVFPLTSSPSLAAFVLCF